MDEFEKQGASFTDLGAGLHHLHLFVLFRPVLRLELGPDVVGSHRSEGEFREIPSVARFIDRFSVDFVQYRFGERKGLRARHPAGARPRQLSSLQYPLRKCSRELDLHDSPRQPDKRLGCHPVLNLPDRHFWRNHTSGGEFSIQRHNAYQ